MKTGVIAICFAAAFFLQSAAGQLFVIFGTGPDFILCFLILFSLSERNHGATLLIGFITALFYDICFSRVIGETALAIWITGMALYVTASRINGWNALWICLLTAIATVLENLIIWAFCAATGLMYQLGYMMKWMLFPICYNTGVSILFYLVMNREKGEEF